MTRTNVAFEPALPCKFAVGIASNGHVDIHCKILMEVNVCEMDAISCQATWDDKMQGYKKEDEDVE